MVKEMDEGFMLVYVWGDLTKKQQEALLNRIMKMAFTIPKDEDIQQDEPNIVPPAPEDSS